MQLFDKDEIKESLSLDQVADLVAELGGEPRVNRDQNLFVAKTICHCGNSHKLYYYDNTRLFRCYTGCENDTFDVFGLVQKVKGAADAELPLPKAVSYVAQFFGISAKTNDFSEEQENLPDWNILRKYDKINSVDKVENKNVEFKNYNENILKHLPHPRIVHWEREGISREVMESRGICFDPLSQGIVIPHYDEYGQLIGIRERTIIEEEEKYGKYRPAIINGQMYNHPLGFSLYNLNFSQENIHRFGRAIVFEGEKSCLKYASMFGEENDISVACCGSSLISRQVQLLTESGAREIIVAFDKQFKELGDAEYQAWVKKLQNIHTKYSSVVLISFMFDKFNLLNYKDSPIDADKETFFKLFKERIVL